MQNRFGKNSHCDAHEIAERRLVALPSISASSANPDSIAGYRFGRATGNPLKMHQGCKHAAIQQETSCNQPDNTMQSQSKLVANIGLQTPESVASTRAAGRRGCGACAASGSGAGRKNLQASHFAAGRPRRAGSQLVASAGGELGIDALEARKCRTRAGKFQREPAPAFDDASRQIHQFLHYGPQSAPFCLMPDR